MKNKKLLHVIVKCICLSFVVSLITFFALNSYSAEQDRKKEEFVVAIDVGHSECSPGAIGARGTKEYALNNAIAKLLNEKLIEYGFKKSFIFQHNGCKVSLESRVNKIRLSKYNVLISIHHDSVQPLYMSSWMYDRKKFNFCDKYKGFSIFVSENNDNSKNSLKLSYYISDALISSGFKPSLHHSEPIEGENRKIIDKNRGVYEFNALSVLKNAHSPAALIECGIMVNRSEEILLNDSSYQNKLVSCIFAGIVKYFKDVR